MHQEFSNPSYGSTEKSEIAATIAHEGTHGIDGRANGGNPRNRSQEYATEYNAFEAEAALAKGLGVNSAYGVWNNHWPSMMANSNRENAVNNYANIATNLWCSWGGSCK